MPGSLDIVLKELPSLSDEGRRQVLQRLKALGAVCGPVASTDDEPNDDWLYDGIIFELRKRHHPKPPPLKILKRTKAWQIYRVNAPAVKEDLLKRLPPLRKAEQLALGRACGEALADYLAEYRVVELRGMLSSVNKVYAALERAAPGYMTNGILKSAILRRG